jgi:hypothetical protein
MSLQAELAVNAYDLHFATEPVAWEVVQVCAIDEMAGLNSVMAHTWKDTKRARPAVIPQPGLPRLRSWNWSRCRHHATGEGCRWKPSLSRRHGNEN